MGALGSSGETGRWAWGVGGVTPDGHSMEGSWATMRFKSRWCGPGFGTETARCRLWPVLRAARAGGKKKNDLLREAQMLLGKIACLPSDTLTSRGWHTGGRTSLGFTELSSECQLQTKLDQADSK